MAGIIVRERGTRGFSCGGREGFPEEMAALLELTTSHGFQTHLSLLQTDFSFVRLSYPSALRLPSQRCITGENRITHRKLSLMLLSRRSVTRNHGTRRAYHHSSF